MAKLTFFFTKCGANMCLAWAGTVVTVTITINSKTCIQNSNLIFLFKE